MCLDLQYREGHVLRDNRLAVNIQRDNKPLRRDALVPLVLPTFHAEGLDRPEIA